MLTLNVLMWRDQSNAKSECSGHRKLKKKHVFKAKRPMNKMRAGEEEGNH